MVITPHNTANGMKLWVADGSSEKELKEGLSHGYIEWNGIRLNIEKIQDWNPTADGLVTKLIHVHMNTDLLDKLNTKMLSERN